jgi:hypothetical protein
VNSKNTIARKAGALLLLLLFLFVHGVKLGHTHDGGRNRADAGTTHIQKTVDCSICDYHIAKDGDNPSTSFDPPLNEAPQLFFLAPCPAPFTSIGLAHSDRGPPASFRTGV